MGSFLTNVQVRFGNLGPDKAHARIVDTLRRLANADGFLETDGDEAPDRCIAIGPASNGWIVIYDEATEDQDAQKLSNLALALSKEMQNAAVTVLVHDSDVLLLQLYVSGRRKGSYDSNPGYFDGKESRKRTVAVEPWKSLLAGGATEESLGRIWEGRDLFAEETLAKTAEVFGWEPKYAVVGYEYLEKNDPALTTLRFRSKERPLYEKKATGPAALKLAGWQSSLELCEGDLAQIHFSVKNTGEETKGIGIAVWGPAAVRGLIAAETAIVYKGRDWESRKEGSLEKVAAQEGNAWICRLPDIVIPAGVGELGLGAPARAGNLKKAIDLEFANQLSILIKGRAIAAGKDDLHLGAWPLEGSREGQTGFTMKAEIGPRQRRPLRFSPTESTIQLLHMQKPAVLFSVIVMGEDRTPSTRAGVRAMEKWHSILSRFGSGTYRTTLSGPDLSVVAKSGTLPGRELAGNPKWQTVRQELSTCAWFDAKRGENISPLEQKAGQGFSLCTSYYGENHDDPDLQTLVLWIDLAGVEPAQAEALREELRAITDEVMVEACGLQAFLDRWQWLPSVSRDATPYEQACGIRGVVTTRKSWCSRFLRAVTSDMLWLGPQLLAKVPDANALGRIVECVPVAGGVRLRVEHPSCLDALEKELAPILASTKDWEQATRII